MTTETAALPTKPVSKRRALLALTKIADENGSWLRYTDRDGNQVSMTPEQVRDLAENRYYADQEWKLISPLDVISEAADVMYQAHAKFQDARFRVTAWYDNRRALDAAKDQEAHHDAD